MSVTALSENKLLALRKKAKLTQKALAELAKTSQQQVARVERGVQRASLELAVRLCKALGQPLEKVFPLARSAVRTMSKMDERAIGDDALNGGQLTGALAKAGLELDPREWRVKVRFTNGVEHVFEVTASEQRRMRDAMFESPQFMVFDSEDARVAVNLDHVEYAHWLFDKPGAVLLSPNSDAGTATDEEEPDPANDVIVLMASTRIPLVFDVDEDVPEDPEEDGGTGQMGHLLYMAEIGIERGDGYRFHFEDVDGEEVFLLPGAVSLLSVPLWVVETAVFEGRIDAANEEEG
jgi:transcriptional regulator with XRE-family HTH domain